MKFRRRELLFAIAFVFGVVVVAATSIHYVRSGQLKSDSRAQMQTQLAWTAVERCMADHGGVWKSDKAGGFDCATPDSIATIQPAFRSQLRLGAQPGGLFPYATADTVMLASISDEGNVPIWYVKLQTRDPKSDLVRLLMRERKVVAGTPYTVCITRMFGGTSPDEKAALESACPDGSW